MSIVREMSGSGQLAAAAGTCWLVVVEEGGGAAYWRKDRDGAETTTVSLTEL